MPSKKKRERGFSLIELLFSMLLTVMILGIAVMTFSSALNSRTREASKTDAITSTQAALNILTREIGNSGYGLSTNGIWLADSNENRLHFRHDTNNDGATDDPAEDVTFYFDAASQSVVRYDANLGATSGIINRISDVDFLYYNYTYNAVTQTVNITETTTPAANTGRVKITLTVTLNAVQGQPTAQEVTVTSDVTLRNSPYMLGQY
jgi:type II secretory pathway component PulJ